MYLWNLLGSCSSITLNTIIEDCKSLDESSEPFLGLTQFLMGASFAVLNDFENAIFSYKKCIEMCNENPSNLHLFYIPAYANYELAVVLRKRGNFDSEEVHKFLQDAHAFKGFDFEHRLKLKLFSVKSC